VNEDTVNVAASVNKPTRPRNIIRIITQRPATVNLPVNPIDSPTVFTALLTSNMFSQSTGWRLFGCGQQKQAGNRKPNGDHKNQQHGMSFLPVLNDRSNWSLLNLAVWTMPADRSMRALLFSPRQPLSLEIRRLSSA
jgi:hypothetical protein